MRIEDCSILPPDPAAYDRAIAVFPVDAQEMLRGFRDRRKFCGVVTAEDASHIAAQSGWDVRRVMLGLLDLARLYARPPISKFCVGAIAQGLSGNLYFGANMEFVGEALSFTVHAEQSATANAWSHGETGLESLAISAPPCGHCRQFLYELTTASTLRILLPDRPQTTLTNLLPDAFEPADLGVQGGLMSHENHQLLLPSDDAVVLAALSAANMSYAPYSKGYAGVALLATDGQIYSGPYAENVAFNPSISPMEAALARLNICGRTYEEIKGAALVEVQDSPCSQSDVTRHLLRSISPVELTVAYTELPVVL
ncbi:MAG: cytidine deaminase [Pyrinomonadaceae bacterium]